MMHSDDIKSQVESLNKDLENIENDARYSDMSLEDRLEIIRTKAILLQVLALNELNWSFFYTKEEMKSLNRILVKKL